MDMAAPTLDTHFMLSMLGSCGGQGGGGERTCYERVGGGREAQGYGF